MSAVLLAFKVYPRKEENIDGSAFKACDDLVNEADLISKKGMILYTDNWYTFMALAKHMYKKY